MRLPAHGFTQAIDPDIRMPTVWRANIGYQADLEFGLEPVCPRLAPQPRLYLQPVQEPVHDRRPRRRFRISARGCNRSRFAIDGRPIYATIDPLLCGAQAASASRRPRPTPGVTAACYSRPARDRANIVLTNAGDYRSHVASRHPVEELRHRHLHVRRFELLHARLRLHQRARPAEHVQLDGGIELQQDRGLRPPESGPVARRSTRAATTSPSRAICARSSSAISRLRWA